VNHVTGQSPACAEADVSQFLKTFIQLYSAAYFKEGNEKTDLHKKYFTKNFYAKTYCGLAPETIDSENCPWDDDPVLRTQDWDESWTKTLKITQIERAPHQRCKAVLNFATGSGQHKLTYFLVQNGKGYRVDGVDWIHE
jgi:hypothetical protein